MRTNLRAGTRHVAGGAIGRSALRGAAVGQGVIEPSAVATRHLSRAAVRTTKIADYAVTQMVTAFDGAVLINSAETDMVSLSIRRNGNSELDLNFSFSVVVAGDDGAGPDFSATIKVYRGATMIEERATGLFAMDHEAAAADQEFGCAYFGAFVDSDEVTGTYTYKFTIELKDGANATIGGGTIVAFDAYLRVLERRK